MSLSLKARLKHRELLILEDDVKRNEGRAVFSNFVIQLHSLPPQQG